jgi:hypothetical protein
MQRRHGTARTIELYKTSGKRRPSRARSLLSLLSTIVIVFCGPNMESTVSFDADKQFKKPLTSTTLEDSETSRAVREWRSWKIKPVYTIVMTLFGILILAVILYLTILSQRDNGFMTVHDRHISGSLVDRYVLDTGLLWTSLPSLIMTLYNLFWGIIAAAAIDRQPFIDLMIKKEVTAARSIALDYRTKPPIWNCIVALNNRHFLVSGLMATGLFMSLMAAAAAHLFVMKSIVSTESTEYPVITAFNSSALTAATDLRPALDLVVATRIYGASPPSWSDGEYAFPTISLPASSNNLNFTASIDAQAAYLACTRLDNSRYSTTLEDATEPGFTKLVMTGNDRGCSIGASVMIQSQTENYLHTFFELSCESDVGNQRFRMVAGTYSASSPTLLQNFSIISCIPQYWKIPGHLELFKSSAEHVPVVNAFVRNTTGAMELGFGGIGMSALFVGGLDIVLALDATSTTSTTEFGRILFREAQKRSTSPMDADVLQDAMSEVFTTTFSMLASTVLFTPTQNGLDLTVKVDTAGTSQRLFVYLPIAGLVCAVITLSVLCTVAVMLYTSTHASILREEPSGLFSYADMLFGSNIWDLVAQVRAHAKYDGRVVGRAKKYFTFDETKCSTTGTGEHLQILVDGMVLAPPRDQWRVLRRKIVVA